MSTTYQVILFSNVPWHITWQRHHDIAAGLATRGHKILFVEPIPKRWPAWSEWKRVWGKLRGNAREAGLCEQPVPEGVTILSPRALPDGQWGLTQWLNRHVLTRSIVNQLAETARQRSTVSLVYLPSPSSLDMVEATGSDAMVYDCVWDWDNDPWASRFPNQEARLLERADLVMADSPYLFEKMTTRHSQAHIVLPAVHPDRWSPSPLPAQAKRPPVCGYFGHVAKNIDIPLLARVAERYPLIIAGPWEHPPPPLPPTTTCLGAVPVEALTAHLAPCDVLLLPYANQPHTQAVIPAKTFECLASGKPVVSINLPSLKQFGDAFTMVDSPDDFLEAIEPAVIEDTAERQAARVELARKNSWDQRVTDIESLLARSLHS